MYLTQFTFKSRLRREMGELKKMIHVNEVESTNDYLRDLANVSSLNNWTCVFADFQTKGKGQRGNQWRSKSGKNILASFFFKPLHLKAENTFLINELVCVSIFNVLESIGLSDVLVKWPNDILVEEKKICGVLIENSVSGKFISESVIGIGLNVNDFPSAYNSTSIEKEMGVTFSVKSILSKISEELVKNSGFLYKPEFLKRQYLNNLYGYNKWVSIKYDHAEWKAKVLDVQSNGMIVVERGEGVMRFAFKEIEWPDLSS